MAHHDRTILVFAKDDPAKPGGIKFSMSGLGVSGDSIKCTKDDAKHSMKKTDVHKIVFELVNDSSVDLRFADQDDAMWVGPKGDLGACPPVGSKLEHVAKVKEVFDDGQRLKVHNYNREADKGQYKFALNFVESGNAANTHCYDPIWDNTNGGKS
jgi:hypothetical protein